MAIGAESFQFVRDLVHRESAMELEAGKEYLVETRLIPLARQAGDNDVDAYVRRLRTAGNRQNHASVVEALTVNETSFFRDIAPFQNLTNNLLPKLADARSAKRRVRMWSAACSSGQEIYSMMIAAENCPEVQGWRLDFLASDISPAMVERAKEGRFNQLEINRGLPAMHQTKYFVRDGNHWQVRQDMRDRLQAQVINLNRTLPPIGTFDIIFLRNVLIYFNETTRAAVYQRIKQVLAPDGYLILGGSESIRRTHTDWVNVGQGRMSVYQPVGSK